jgi:hypothetical protein
VWLFERGRFERRAREEGLRFERLKSEERGRATENGRSVDASARDSGSTEALGIVHKK